MSDEGEGLQTGAHAGLGPGAAQETDPGAASSATTSTLEALPFEIQRLILTQSPTLDTLIAAVNASPRLHSVYVQDRASILRDFVQQSLDGILFDAYAAYLSGLDEFKQTRTEPKLWEFLDAYQQRRNTTAETDLAAQLSPEDVMEMARFHASVIEPLTERYAIWVLAALSSSPSKHPLSGTERQRIQRGMYRYEIICNLFGSKGEGRSAPGYIEGHVDRCRALSLFPAWQVEEILCIWKFARDTYGGIFDQVAWDLDEERNPKYQHVSLPDVREHLLLYRYGYASGLAPEPRDVMLGHGLALLSSVFKTSEHDQLVELVRHGIDSAWSVSSPPGDIEGWLNGALSFDSQDARREEWYNEHDAAQDRREKMPFEGDSPDRPPLAWVILWKGEASNFFGSYVLSSLRRWGYIMWDAPRLQGSGATYFLSLDPRAAFQTFPCTDRRDEFYHSDFAESDD